ncbi:MAG: MASE3 domain-containing protein, partial [Anaerolineae bacterium]
LFVGVIDLLHTLAFKDMGVFPNNDANLPTQLWIAARYLESLALFSAPWFLARKVSASRVLIGYTTIVTLLLVAIFGGLFPDCYIEGVGLTPFKKVSEYVISLLLLATMVYLYQHREQFDKSVLQSLMYSLVVAVAAELAFTFYINVHDLFNLAGHFLKSLSFLFIYKAIIETGLKRPYNLLFRGLTQSKENLQQEEDALKKSLAQIERAKQEWETTADALPQLVCLLDDQGHVVRANRTVERWGLAPVVDVKGRDMHELLHIDCADPDCSQSTFWHQALEELVHGRSVEREARDEILNRHLHIQARPIATWTGELDGSSPTFAAVVIQDITERVQAEEELRRYAHEQAALYAITSAVATSLDPDELLSTVLDIVLPVLDSTTGWITLPGPTLDDPPRIAAWRGIPASFVTAETEAPLSTCPICIPLLTSDDAQIEPALIAECPRLPPDVLDGSNIHSHIGIPLSASDKTLAILIVAWHAPRPYSESDRALLTAIGREVGMALYNAQLYQAARQVDRLRVLNELDRALAATLDPEVVAEVTLRRVAAALDTPVGALILFTSRGEEYMERVLTLTEGWMELALAPRDAGRLQTFLQELRDRREVTPFFSDELDALITSIDYPQAERWGSGVMFVPIWSENEQELIAALALGGRSTDRPFTDEDQELAQAAANQAAQAIQNARLYDELWVLLRERRQAQAQLIHSEKMSALGRLVASLAHEINNPIQAVQGCLTLTEEELDGEQRREKLDRYLGIVGSEIERVATIVRRMRDFYRPARTGMRPTDLHTVLESVLALSGKQLQHSNVTVERHWTQDLPQIRANADHLKQVFLNLVLNAIDAMPQGGTLRITTALESDEPDSAASLNSAASLDSATRLAEKARFLRVEFSDTGMGMSPEVQSRLFEPFFTTKEKGSGLGLSISYSIIETHEGQITVASQEGMGATFTILLPIVSD